MARSPALRADACHHEQQRAPVFRSRHQRQLQPHRHRKCRRAGPLPELCRQPDDGSGGCWGCITPGRQRSAPLPPTAVPAAQVSDSPHFFGLAPSLLAGKDVRSLALLLLLTLVQLWSQRGLLRIPQLAAATACSGAVVAALACALTQPTVYRRRRQPIVAALRLLLAVSTLLSGSSLELFASAAAPAHAQTLLQALPHFLLLLAWESGALLLGQVRTCSRLAAHHCSKLAAPTSRTRCAVQVLPACLNVSSRTARFQYRTCLPSRPPHLFNPGRLEPGAAAAAGHDGAAGWCGGCGQPQQQHLCQPLHAAARQPPADGPCVCAAAAGSGAA